MKESRIILSFLAGQLVGHDVIPKYGILEKEDFGRKNDLQS